MAIEAAISTMQAPTPTIVTIFSVMALLTGIYHRLCRILAAISIKNTETHAMPPTGLDRLKDIIDRMSPVLEIPSDPPRRPRAKRGEGKRRADRENTSYVAVHLP